MQSDIKYASEAVLKAPAANCAPAAKGGNHQMKADLRYILDNDFVGAKLHVKYGTYKKQQVRTFGHCL